jgi:uncharacterized protein YodC (DUF2158 family)
MSKFNVGDVVALKSGGPAMTIARLEDNGDIICVWMAEGGATYGGFPVACLDETDVAVNYCDKNEEVIDGVCYCDDPLCNK